MKKLLSFLSLMIFGITASLAQNVGMGTATPNASAKLHIEDTNRGLLIPRVSLTAVTNGITPVNAPITGLLVYNTNAAVTGGSGTGFYYWTGTQWSRLLNTESNDWALLGNAGTNPATNFVGTTDAQNLTFRTGNTEKFRMTTTGSFQAALNGTAGAPVFSWSTDPNMGIYRFGADQMAVSTAGITRLWMSAIGEVFVGATAPVLPGDMFISTNLAALPWSVNGYTTGNGAGIFGMRVSTTAGMTAYGAIQGEVAAAANLAATRAVYGIVSTSSQYGVNGTKPAGGLGWGGLFTNDLGYTGFFGNASDRSLKKNIQPLSGALSIISQLPIYSYQYKTELYDVLGDESTHFGVMADELKVLLPDLVKSKTIASGASRNLSPDEQQRGIDTPVDLVNYIELIPIAIQAIKEQQTLIEAQNAAIEELRREIELLKKEQE